MSDFLVGLLVTIVVGLLMFGAVLGIKALVESGPKCPPGYSLYQSRSWDAIDACFKDGTGVVPH